MGKVVLAGNILRDALVNVVEQLLRLHRVPLTAAVLAVTRRPVCVEQLLEWSWCYAFNANHRYFLHLAFRGRLRRGGACAEMYPKDGDFDLYGTSNGEPPAGRVIDVLPG
ncbi:hypothetical protein D9M68_917780 [compost metagenome]